MKSKKGSRNEGPFSVTGIVGYGTPNLFIPYSCGMLTYTLTCSMRAVIYLLTFSYSIFLHSY